jgi:hypothetical protein
MKCAKHNESDAVGTCNHCGRGLCPECAAIFTPPLCVDCALAHNREIAKSFRLQLAMMGGLFVTALVLFMGKVSAGSVILYSLMAAFFPSGWSFLGRYFSPGGGYLFPVARWMNLVLQASVALLLGIVVGPIHLYQAWKELKTIRETQEIVGERSTP